LSSENLKDAVDWPIWEAVARSDRNNAVHPILFHGAGLEHWIHPKIVPSRVDRLASGEFLDDAGRTGAQTLICHDDQRTVRCPEYKPHIQLDARIRAHRLPVVTGDYLAG
jgi:hypothetical protein